MGLGFGVWGLGFRVLGLGFLGFSVYRPPEVDRIWGIRGSYYHIPRAIFYLLKGGYRERATGHIRIMEKNMEATIIYWVGFSV